MSLRIGLEFLSSESLITALADHASQGMVLLACSDIPVELKQFSTLRLLVTLGDRQQEIDAEVVQLIANMGIVVRCQGFPSLAILSDPTLAGPSRKPRIDFPDFPDFQAQPEQEEEEQADETFAPEEDDDEEEEPPTGKRGGPQHLDERGMGPMNWPVEKLQAEWADLNKSEKIRVAKYGRRPARGLIIRSTDRQLHQYLLQNPRITADEIAAIAGIKSQDPALLRRIAGNTEWLRSTAVVRNLITNPRMSVNLLGKLIRHLPEAELRRLTRTGAVRAATKREIIRFLDRGQK